MSIANKIADSESSFDEKIEMILKEKFELVINNKSIKVYQFSDYSSLVVTNSGQMFKVGI